MDIDHNRSKAVAISIDKDNTTAKMTLISFGIISVGFGVAVYYVLPLALLSFNISLFIGIFFGILISLLLGLVMLALNVQYLVERFVVSTFLIWERYAIRLIILKNLAAHRLRNRKTAIMYALGLSFIIFISVFFALQLETAKYRSLRWHGVYLEVATPRWEADPLPASYLENILNDFDDIIDSYSWVTLEMDDVAVDEILLKHIGQIYEFRSRVVGVSPNLFDTIIPDFIEIEREDDGDLTPSEKLYTPRGSQSGILGTTFIDKLQLTVDEDSTFIIQIYDENQSTLRELRPIVFMNSCSGFEFSRFPQNTQQNLLVSIPTYMDMIKDYLGNVNSVPMGRLLIKLDTSNDDDIDELYNELNDAVKNMDANVWDYRDVEESNQESAALLGTIFSVVSIIAMGLSFFSLVSSMTSNILEQTKEIAILRAMGIRRFRVALIYVYESFVLTLSASILGMIIGTIVAWTMVAQQIAFTDLPIPFTFPWPITIAVLVGSIACAFASSFVPAYRMVKKSIAEVMRITS